MAKIKNKKTGEIREVSDKELKQYGLGGKLPKAKLGKDVDPFMQNAIGNRINYWEERNANGELPQQINLGNVGGQSNLPKFVAQDYGDIDESQFGQQNPNYTENPFLTQEIVKEPDYKNSVQLNKQIQDYRNPKPNITFKKPEMNMLPTMGNKYFQRGMQYLNQSIDHASAIGTDPNSWEQPLDYYNGISNSPFSSTKVDKKYTTLKPKQDSYTLPTQEVQLPERQFSITPNLNKFDNGGRQSIYVNDPKDEKLHSYLDSLNLYNSYQTQLKYNPPQNVNNSFDARYLKPNTAAYDIFVNAKSKFNKSSPQQKAQFFKNNTSDYWKSESQFKKDVPEDAPLIDAYKKLSFSTPTKTGLWTTPDLYNNNIAPIDIYFGGKTADSGAWNPVYKKPVQPYQYSGNSQDYEKYRSTPTIIGTNQKFNPKEQIQTVSNLEYIPELKRIQSPTLQINQEQQYLPQSEQHLDFDPIGLKKGTYFTRPRQQQEAGQGKMDYFDNKTGKLIKTMGDGGMNQNQFNNLQALGTGVNATQSGINFGKGTLDMIGSMNQNNQVQNMENQLYSQSVFSGNIDNRPMEQYGYNWSGRNALAENGMQIKEIGGQGTPSVEVEGNEHIKLPNGFSQEIKGKSHSEGGIPLNLPLDSKVFSEKLKIETPKGKKSYADLAKKFETKKNFDMLDSKYADGIQKSTADMMIKFKNQQLENLFEMQEQNKMQGLHGQDVQMETMQDYTPEAKYGMKLPKFDVGGVNYAALLNVEKQLGVLKNGMPSSTGYDDKSIHQLDSQMVERIKGTIGEDTWNKLPDNLKTQVFSFAFNNGVEKKNWLTGLAQAIDPAIKDRTALSETDAISIIKNNIGKIDNNVYNNYINKVLPSQYNSIASSNNKQEENKKLWQFRPDNINQFLQNSNNQTPTTQPSVSPTFTGVNPFVDIKALRLSPAVKKRRDEFLPFTSQNTPDVYGDPAYRESVFKDFEDRTGIKLNRANSDAVNLEAIRKYQNARTPELTKDYKLNFTRGNQDLYNEFTKQKGYKKSPDEVKESNKFYDWAVANNKLNADYTDKGKWGHEYYNTAPLNFETEAEYNKWKQDPDWEQVGKYFVDRSGDPNGMITYYDVHKNWKNPVTKTGEPNATTKETEKIVYKQPKYDINPNVNLEFPLPNVYSRTPLNYYQIDPSYIDPRYLDVQPQLNEISRGQRAFQNNLGSRGTTDIANLLQSQANGYNAQQQAFGNKYNYDRGQDATAQQFNAQAKMNTDQYNQQSWFNQLENSIRQRESNIGDQELTDMYRGQERADQAIQFKNTKNYIDDTYSQYQNMSPEEWSARMEFLSKFKPKDSEKKYGGKIKPKLKKKSVNNR